jgi:hypothetical protein
MGNIIKANDGDIVRNTEAASRAGVIAPKQTNRWVQNGRWWGIYALQQILVIS